MPRFAVPRSNKSSDDASCQGWRHLLMLTSEANFRSRRPGQVAGRGAGHLRELLLLLGGAQHFKPNLLTCICARTICTGSTVYTMSSSRPRPELPDRPQTVAGHLHSRGPTQLRPRSAVRTFRSAFYTRPSARCYMPHAARLRTVAAMLILAFVPLIVSRYDGLPIVAIRPAFRGRAWHSRPPKR